MDNFNTLRDHLSSKQISDQPNRTTDALVDELYNAGKKPYERNDSHTGMQSHNANRQ